MTSDRTVRLFLSSTFRDFSEERDLLVKRVFPALRARLKDRFVDLVDVDLRWGITAKEAERGEVLPICLAEIDRARPYFIGMLGERYGWIPTSAGYDPQLLERQPWLKPHQGGKSVTELEILHGVLNNRYMKGRAFFYLRSPTYASAKGGDYLPASPEDAARQRELKRRIRARGLPVAGYAHPQALARRIERDLWKLLDAEFPASQVPDAFERERLRHEAYAAPRRRLYLGGERYERVLEQALAADTPRILVEGPCGAGKTALLAHFLPDWQRQNARQLVFAHHLGASADAADPHALVRRLIEFIQRQTSSTHEIADQPQALMDSLPLWLATASGWSRRRRTRWVIVLDGLQALTRQADLRWWPDFLPAGITLLVACQPGPVLQALKSRVVAPSGRRATPDWTCVKIQPLPRTHRAQLLTTYLARFNKKLPAPLVRQVQAHPLASNPLFLRTLAEELRLFGVHEQLQQRLDHYLESVTLDDLFERVLERVEQDCGRRVVRTTMTAIWASRAGLSEKEILAVAGLAPAAWAVIRLALDEALTEINGRIQFAQDPVRIAVGDRYLPGVRAQRNAHRQLAVWFGQQPQTARRAQEETWQWRAAGDERSVLRCLVDRASFMSIHAHQGIAELMALWLGVERQLKLRMEDVLPPHWRSWVRGLSPREQRTTADALVDLLTHASRQTAFTLRLARRGLALARQDRSVPRHARVNYINELAVLYKDRGEYAHAEPLYLEALALARKLPISHRESLAFRMNNLAVFYKKTDRYAQAEGLYRESLAISAQISGPHSESVAITQSNLASLLRQAGRLTEALACANQAVTLLTRIHGEDDPGLITALNNRGKVLESQNKNDLAERSFQQALALGCKLLGEQDLTVALIQNNLASLLEDTDPERATRYARQALQTRRKALPALHPDIGASLEVMGSCAGERGDTREAMAWFSEALALYEAIGLRSDAAGAQNRLGLLAHESGEYDQAEKHYLTALANLRALGLGESRRGLTLTNNLAMLLKEKGDLPEALVMARHALRLRQTLYPELPARLATATHNVAHILEAMGQHAQALRLYKRALHLLEHAFGASHSELLDTLVSLGTLLAQMGRPHEGIAQLRRARQISLDRLGADHPKTGSVLYYLGEALIEARQVPEGQEVLQTEIRIAEKNEGAQSESVRLSLRHLGVLLRDCGQLDEAEVWLTRALTLARRLHGRTSVETSPELNALGKLRMEQGQLHEAQELLQTCLRLRQADPNTDPDDVRSVQERLALVRERIASAGAP